MQIEKESEGGEYVREKNKQDEYLKWVFQPAIFYVSEHVPPKLLFLIKIS